MEARRSARVASDLWVAVEGVDEVLALRDGDVSISGVYFRVDHPVGAVGSVQRLHMAAHEHATVISVLARVIRVVYAEDLTTGRTVVGAGFEFMPDSAVARMALGALVRGVMEARARSHAALEVEHRYSAQVFQHDAPGQEARVHRLGTRRMVLDTHWPLSPGASVRVAIELGTTGTPVRFDAVAADTQPDSPDPDGRYRIELRIQEGHSAGGQGAVGAPGLDSLFADLVAPVHPEAPLSRKDHLTGMIARIRLTSLVQLFELERMTGRLRVSREGAHGAVYLRDGRVVDAELTGESTPRAAVMAMLGWTDGEFEFQLGTVDREDRVRASTSGLLLDLAREEDEARR